LKKERYMRSLAFFLAVLTLSAGCVLEDKPVIPEDGGVEAGPCGICEFETPVCNVDLQCVPCTADLDDFCTDMALVCKTGAFECVACNANSDCNDPSAARCDPEQNECEGCETEADCIGIEGLPRCEARTCVECTPGTEEADCNGNSCDPATFMCTGTKVGSLETCEECVADSECGQDGNRCVPMTYDGARYPNEGIGFCLKSIDLGGSCANPYRIVVTRTSLSGAAADDYCGINEDLATCLAVRALLADTPCNPVNADQDCPQPAGLCRELPGMVNRCTYLCSSVVECVTPGSNCGPSGAGGAYCGGG
jgi:hypothetical protein